MSTMDPPFRILVVAGARALSRTRAARLWAVGYLASRIYNGQSFDAVAHGGCRSSPDEWADELASVAAIDRVVWALGKQPRVYDAYAGLWRGMVGHERFPYKQPLERNAAMALWAGSMLRRGLDVRAVTLRCPWPMRDGERATQGTANARDELIRELGVDRVSDMECPTKHGPQHTFPSRSTDGTTEIQQEVTNKPLTTD